MVAAKLANMPLGGAVYRSANLRSDNVSRADLQSGKWYQAANLQLDCRAYCESFSAGSLIMQICRIIPISSNIHIRQLIDLIIGVCKFADTDTNRISPQICGIRLPKQKPLSCRQMSSGDSFIILSRS